MNAKAKVVAEVISGWHIIWAGNGPKVGDKLIPLTDHEAAMAELQAECQLRDSQVEGLTTEIQILTERLQRTSDALTAGIGKNDTLLTGLEALAGEIRQRMNHVAGGLEGSWNRWQYDTYERIEADMRTLAIKARSADTSANGGEQ